MAWPIPIAIVAISAACGRDPQPRPSARPQPIPGVATAPTAATPRPTADADLPGDAPAVSHAEPTTPETCLGVGDHGIWSDLDPEVQLAVPAGVTADRVRATVDEDHHVLVLWIDGHPAKPYPLVAVDAPGAVALTVGDRALSLRAGDRGELAPLLTAANLVVAPATPDRDRDGIPDPLDVLIGARKTALNADAYTEGYVSMSYPNGDVPRTMGVCTDVIVRALRNAGIDLQAELHKDIARAPRAYPMVKAGGDHSIDHRRVRTILPYFLRHFEAHTPRLDDAADPFRPGDVVFMDTFPTRAGPDHIGIVSDHVDDQGLPLIINNWTDGTVTTEMDLMTFVPVTHRFRIVPRDP